MAETGTKDAGGVLATLRLPQFVATNSTLATVQEVKPEWFHAAQTKIRNERNTMHPGIASTFVLLAQTDPSVPVESFELLLANILLLVGVATVACGASLVAGRRHTIAGILCIIGGFIVSMAVPLIAYIGGYFPGITF